jgi:acyl transferase domain-containing protein/acyl carrier protein
MTEPAGRLLSQSAKKLALLGERLRASPGQCFLSEPIAVIGMACRFPGAATVERFWQLLLQGREAIAEIPPGRWDVDAYFDPDPQVPGKSYSRWGGFLDDVDQFDAAFFGISPREARHMDPRQRILLETAWAALEDAGLAPERLAGSDAGVFIGHMVGDYYALEAAYIAGIDSHASTGNLDSLLANRLSYVLDLRGPSLAVDTACSSSLVALYLACQGLRQGECRVAIAGGINLILTPEMHVMGAKSRLLSSKGRCRTFDRDADGFVRGEGCGLLILKRYADALADDDPVRAVIRGIAINQDGRTNGISAPNGLSQQRVIRRALDNALLDASQVTFVETHGTATVVGDAVEFEALAQLYGQPSAQGACHLGAVKTNVGHLEGAAGAAGVIKMVLCLRHGLIPPNLNFRAINPHLALESTRFRFPLKAEPWAVADGPRRGAVSSFGLGGTNGHVVLEEAPEQAARRTEASRPAHRFQRQRYWLPLREPTPRDPLDDLLYHLEWWPRPLGAPTAPAHPGDWLIVSQDRDLSEALADRLSRSGQRAVVAREFRPSPAGRYRGVVHLSGASDQSDPPTAAEAGCIGLLHLVQALSRSGDPARLWLVTQASQAVASDDKIRVDQAALWGLARTVRLEHPELKCVSVDLESRAADLDHLVAEMIAPEDSQVAYRDGKRYVARLVRLRGETAPREVPIREDASYLITGGLGALGLTLAGHLVDRGARRLVLAGRGARADDPRVEELRSCGAAVEVVQADISRPADVARLVAICQAHGPLLGVVHAAGVLDDGILDNQTAGRFARVMAPKARGAWELHVKTQDLPLDFFVCFSSLAALLGSPGQGNYAAANAFLDALAHHRLARGLAALSINWGPWSHAGMAAGLHSRLQAHGEGLIDPATGVRVFSRALGQRTAQLGAMRIDWGRYAAAYPAPEFLERLVDPPGLAAPEVGLLRRLRAAPAARRAEMLVEHVQSQVASVLGHPVGSLTRTQGFAHLGMDSLASIELRTRLERALDCRLPTTLAFDHPNVESLTAHLLGVTGLKKADSAREALEGLTGDEIAALLAQELRTSEEGNGQ